MQNSMDSLKNRFIRYAYPARINLLILFPILLLFITASNIKTAFAGVIDTGNINNINHADNGIKANNPKNAALDKLKALKIPFDKASFLNSVREGNYPVVKLFLEAGMDPNAGNPKDGNTPLIYAALNGNIKIVKLLLSYNADVNAKSYSGFTPIAAALFSGHAKVLKILQKNSSK